MPNHSISKASALFLLLSVLLLSSCGWHFRGIVNLPEDMNKTYVKGTAQYSELGVAIQSIFSGQSARLVDSMAQATAILDILTENYSRRVLSTDTLGRASEYELNYLLVFKLINKDGDLMVSEQKISVKREFRFDPNNVLSNDFEEKQLRNDMINFSVQTMFRRISISLRTNGQAG